MHITTIAYNIALDLKKEREKEMKKVKLSITLILVFAMLAAITVGCGQQKTPVSSTKPETTPTATAKVEEPEVIKIGLVAPLTGTNKLVGQYIMNGAKLAQEEINAAGGINGKQIELVPTDEVDNMQDSVNATTKLISDGDISAIIGSLYSQYCIAVMPSVADAKIPYFASGSSSGVSKQKNPYTWQIRPIDTFQGITLANFAVNTLNMKKPAIMYSTQSTFASLSEQVQIALKDLGIEITESNLFGFPEEEINYAPYFAQILAGGYDGIIALSNQMPAALIMQQAEIAGVDPKVIPTLGSTSFCSSVAITNAGSASNGWYSVADWVPGGANDRSAEFEAAYVAKYNAPSDLPAATFYDAMYVLKKASEIAGSTEREAINSGLAKIKALPAAISTASYFEDHVFATALGITQNVDEKPKMIDAVTFREP